MQSAHLSNSFQAAASKREGGHSISGLQQILVPLPQDIKEASMERGKADVEQPLQTCAHRKTF
jgi:hypothetical protein